MVQAWWAVAAGAARHEVLAQQRHPAGPSQLGWHNEVLSTGIVVKAQGAPMAWLCEQLFYEPDRALCAVVAHGVSVVCQPRGAAADRRQTAQPGKH